VAPLQGQDLKVQGRGQGLYHQRRAQGHKLPQEATPTTETIYYTTHGNADAVIYVIRCVLKNA